MFYIFLIFASLLLFHSRMLQFVSLRPLQATGTVEEKIFQRQLSKEGLQSVVDDKEQVNALSTKDLKNLFKLRQGTPSDTHDKL